MENIIRLVKDKEKVKFLTTKNIPHPFASVLVARGLDKVDVLRRFITPKLSSLSDPFLIPDMEKAVQRIAKALNNKEKIGIFGDFDVDGVSSTALLYYVLSELGADVEWYIPSRLQDGYGLSRYGIDKLRQKGVNLIVTVDCGVSDIDQIDYATSIGLDCIITDHHELPPKLPSAYALVNSKTEGSPEGTGQLAGVGMAFKLAQSLYLHLGMDAKEVYKHLDLVALGTAADIVPLTGENRILMKHGLKQLAKSRKAGLRLLLDSCGLSGSELTTSDIVFKLAPRLNSPGRVGSAFASCKLLTTYNYSLASKLVKYLERENKRRRKMDEQVLLMAEEKLAKLPSDKWRKVIVLDDPGWHIGIIGIVAARLVDKYYKPTILINSEGNVCKGSARSVPGFHILDAIRNCRDSLIGYGGHKHAAGLTIKKAEIERFRKLFAEYAEKYLPEKLLMPTLYIDGYLDSKELSIKLLKWIKHLAPYGPENMRPVFLINEAPIIGEPRLVGDNHLLFKVMGNKRAFDVIGFGFGEKITKIRARRSANLACVLDCSKYTGIEDLKLRIKDIKFQE